MIKYKNKKDEIIRTRLDKILFESGIKDYKDEKRNFFRSHKYVLGCLTQKRADALWEYFVQNDKKTTYDDIAAKRNITHEAVRILIKNSIDSLRQEPLYSAICMFNDSDVDCTEYNYIDFDLNRIEELVEAYNEMDREAEEIRFNNLPAEDQETEMCFKFALNRTLGQLPLQTYPSTQLFDANTTIGEVLAMDESKFKSHKYKEIVSVLHKLGFEFHAEHECYDAW